MSSFNKLGSFSSSSLNSSLSSSIIAGFFGAGFALGLDEPPEGAVSSARSESSISAPPMSFNSANRAGSLRGGMN